MDLETVYCTAIYIAVVYCLYLLYGSNLVEIPDPDQKNLLILSQYLFRLALEMYKFILFFSKNIRMAKILVEF